MSTSIPHVLLFTDLVDSTGWKDRLGDRDYTTHVRQPHDAIFREVLARFPGSLERDNAGDGFLATFANPSDAVRAALAFHQALAEHDWNAAVRRHAPPQTRIGIHWGEVVEYQDVGGMKVSGQAVDLAARIMSLAQPGQTLFSRFIDASARQHIRDQSHLEWKNHGAYKLKGDEANPLELCEAGVPGHAPLTPPPDGAKGVRVVVDPDADTRGWRPSLGAAIPRREGWIIERQLGIGGFGEVWLGKHARTKELRVFKFCFDSERLRSFKRELTFFKLIKSELGNRPDFVTLYEVQVEKPPYFLESEFVEGGNLADWVKDHGGFAAWPVEDRLRFLGKTARAVAAAHSLGIIHKDLKPSNILVKVDETGLPQPLLADFGIGILYDRSTLEGRQITETGFTESILLGNDSSRTGTRLYSPPESQIGKPATTGYDIYALGVILYQMVTGDFAKPLGTGWQDDVQAAQVSHGALLQADIAAATVSNPEKRLTTAAEFAERLETLAQRAEEQRLAERLVQAKREVEEQRRRRYLQLKVGSIVMLALAIGGGLAVWQWREAKRNLAIAQEETALANSVKDFLRFDVLLLADPATQQEEGGALKYDAEVLLRDVVLRAAEKIEGKFKDRPLVEADIRSTLGETLRGMGRADVAAKQLERVCELRSKHLGRDHPFTLLSMNSLACSYHDLGREREAINLQGETLALQKAKLGSDHPNTLASMNSLALNYAALGRETDALKLREETLALRKAKLGLDHPDTLASMGNLVVSYNALGRPADALKLQEQTLSLMKVKLGLDHPVTLIGMSNLAQCYVNIGRPANALKLLEETLTLCKAKLGLDHPNTLSCMSKLAQCYAALGRQTDALKLHEETLSLRKAKLGPDHPDTLGSMNSLALSYDALGRLADALKLNEETLSIRKAKLGPDHPDTLLTQINLASNYSGMGWKGEALKLREETLVLMKARLGPDHPNTLASQTNLGISYRQLKRESDALPLLEDSFKRKLNILPANHQHLYIAAYQLANCYWALKYEANAIATVDRYLQHISSEPGASIKWIADILSVRIKYCIASKDSAGCRITAEIYEKRNPKSPGELFDAACFRAVTASVQAKTPDPDAARLAQDDADKAMVWLQKAVAAGYKDRAHMEKDADLDFLRGREDFKKLIAGLPEAKSTAPPK